MTQERTLRGKDYVGPDTVYVARTAEFVLLAGAALTGYDALNAYPDSNAVRVAMYGKIAAAALVTTGIIEGILQLPIPKRFDRS